VSLLVARMNLKKSEYVEEPVTIFNFVYLLSELGEFSDLNNIFTTEDLYKELSKRPEKLLKFREVYEPIAINLLKDATRKKASFPSFVHQETRPIAKTIEAIEYYLIKDLLNWLKTRYEINIDVFPYWAKQHFKNVDEQKLIIEIEDKHNWVEILTLPKFIQLAIKGFRHFDWKNISTNIPTSKHKINAVNYFNKEARSLSLDHMFESDGKLSGKMTDQLTRIIDPKNDNEK
jgi:hypothetical protein